MAGSHTMMPGIIYTNTSVLNVANATSGIPNNQEITFSLNRQNVNGTLNIIGHPNTLMAANFTHRAGNKLTLQGAVANPNLITSLNTTSSSTTSILSNQIISNGITDNSGHNHEQSNSNSESSNMKQNCVEVCIDIK